MVGVLFARKMLTLQYLDASVDDTILSTADLLNITPSANNGTAGELNYLLEDYWHSGGPLVYV